MTSSQPDSPANGTPASDGTSTVEATRTSARRRAVQLLFEIEQRSGDVEDILQQREAGVGDPVPPYAALLVRGVHQHRERISELLSTYSQGWTLDRMPAVDRQVLRIGVFELLWSEDVPAEVAVHEAVTLARKMSTDASPNFVNGLLGRLKDLGPAISAD